VIGPASARGSQLGRMLLAALAAAAAGWGVRLLVGGLGPIPQAMLIFSAFGAVYFAVTSALRLPEARIVTSRLSRLIGRRR